jgi:hypothetical protein
VAGVVFSYVLPAVGFSVRHCMSIQPFANDGDWVDYEQAQLIAGLPLQILLGVNFRGFGVHFSTSIAS